MQVISSLQDSLLRQFGGVPDSESFYLTGGTALAHFYLKHRRSNDLDFFTVVEELIDPFSRQLQTAMERRGMVVERQRGFRSFVELVATREQEQTLIHLAQDAVFRFEPVRTFPEYVGLNVDNLVDIASNKLLALFGRATLRDFIDVYALVNRGHFQTEELIEKAKRKDPGFDLYWLGVAFERLKTFRDDSPEMLLLVEPIQMKQLRDFFDRWRAQITHRLES